MSGRRSFRPPCPPNEYADPAGEMRAGQTLALAGLIQTRIESQKRGWPVLMDIPWAGAAFRRVEEAQNEIELVVTVRPELVAAMDPHEVPARSTANQSQRTRPLRLPRCPAHREK